MNISTLLKEYPIWIWEFLLTFVCSHGRCQPSKTEMWRIYIFIFICQIISLLLLLLLSFLFFIIIIVEVDKELPSLV